MQAIIFHGTGSSPDQFWFPWLSRQLIQKGYTVSVPAMPAADKPDIKSWLPFALQHQTYDSETVLIGHSSGCPLILSILENISVRVKKVILVAGFAFPLKAGQEDPILQKSYDWQLIKSRFGSLIIINSDNDPWGCDDKAGKFIFDQLGGTQIIRHAEGHMGSASFNQPYKEFPLLLELIGSEAV